MWKNILKISLFFYPLNTHQSPIPDDSRMQVKGFLPGGPDFRRCVLNMNIADVNKDKHLDSAEYATFIIVQSAGRISGNFSSLGLSLTVPFYVAACTTCYEVTRVESCCLGDRASIPLALENITEQLLLSEFLCSRVDQVISERVPSLPTDAPSPAPFSLAPSHMPSGAVSSVSPTDSPTTVDSVSPSLSPDTMPPHIISPAPSDVPSTNPTTQPSPTSSDRPSDVPSTIPSPISSEQPSSVPSFAPSVPDVPSAEPTPDPGDLLCIDFGYSFENQLNLTAEDIMTSNGTDIKTGLLIATREITIKILNETFPQRNSISDDTESRRGRQLDKVSRAVELAVIDIYSQQGMNAQTPVRVDPQTAWSRSDRAFMRLRLLSSEYRNRRLAFYSDRFPVTILSILDNPFCPQGTADGTTLCAVVQSQVCVILEEGDDRDIVRSTIVSGIRLAVNSGEFWQLVPPEFKPLMVV